MICSNHRELGKFFSGRQAVTLGHQPTRAGLNISMIIIAVVVDIYSQVDAFLTSLGIFNMLAL